MSEVKTCRTCGVEKPATTEYFRAAGPWLRNRCRECERERVRQYYEENTDKVREYKRQYYEENTDKVREYHRRWREENVDRLREYKRQYYEENTDKVLERVRQYYEENADKVRERHHQYREENADKVREYNRQYYEENADKVRESVRRWQQVNPDKLRVIRQRRKARKRALPDTLTPDGWNAALVHFNGCCAACGRPPGLFHTIAMDHWIPLSADDCPGTTPDNIVPLCHGVDGCNNSKNNRDAGEWLVDKFGPRKGKQIQDRIEGWLKEQERELQ